MKIVTHFEHPPIPIRTMDYSAFDDDTYDGSESCRIGRGATAEAAVLDLAEQSVDDLTDDEITERLKTADDTTKMFLVHLQVLRDQ